MAHSTAERGAASSAGTANCWGQSDGWDYYHAGGFGGPPSPVRRSAAPYKTCTACARMLQRNYFANGQWKLPWYQIRCRECNEAGRTCYDSYPAIGPSDLPLNGDGEQHSQLRAESKPFVPHAPSGDGREQTLQNTAGPAAGPPTWESCAEEEVFGGDHTPSYMLHAHPLQPNPRHVCSISMPPAHHYPPIPPNVKFKYFACLADGCTQVYGKWTQVVNHMRTGCRYHGGGPSIETLNSLRTTKRTESIRKAYAIMES